MMMKRLMLLHGGCRPWPLQVQQQKRSLTSSSSTSMVRRVALPALSVATATTMAGATGFLVHHHLHSHENQLRLLSSTSSSSHKNQEGKDDEEQNQGTTASKTKISSTYLQGKKDAVFDITKEWAKHGSFANNDYDTPSRFLSRIFPASNSNVAKCEKGEENNNTSNSSSKDQNTKDRSSSFLSQFQNAVTDVLDDVWAPSDKNDNKSAALASGPTSSTDNDTKEKEILEQSYMDMVGSLVGLLTTTKSNKPSSPQSFKNNKNNVTETSTIDDIIDKARQMSETGDVSDKSSLLEVMDVCKQAMNKLMDDDSDIPDEILNNLPIVHPTNIFYYLEHEESAKNPSYRRRKHRFFQGVDTNEVNDLNDKLRLALLSYEDNIQNIQTNLETKFDCELVYCSMESLPGKPSHFIAVKKNTKSKKDQQLSFSSFWSSDDDDCLDMILVVRGTKTITDVITDLLMDATEYRNGYAHQGILESGQYLATKHDELFQNLCKVSGKKRINLTLVG